MAGPLVETIITLLVEKSNIFDNKTEFVVQGGWRKIFQQLLRQPHFRIRTFQSGLRAFAKPPCHI